MLIHVFFLLADIYQILSGKSDNDSCTLYSDRTLINRRNVRADPKCAYRADRDFLPLVLSQE